MKLTPETTPRYTPRYTCPRCGGMGCERCHQVGSWPFPPIEVKRPDRRIHPECSRCGAALDKSGPLCELCLKADNASAQLKAIMLSAVLAERERCAKIARDAGESVAREAEYICGVDCGCGESIAAKIMEGK